MNELILENILEEYSIESGTNNDLELLRQYMQKYPDFSAELMDFAASRSIMKRSPEPQITQAQESEYLEIGRKAISGFRNATEKKTSDSLRSLTRAGMELGLSKQKLAGSLGISVSLLMYLEKKKLQARSIPGQLIRNIADTIHSTEDSVAAYLSSMPPAAGQVSYKSQSRPGLESGTSSFKFCKIMPDPDKRIHPDDEEADFPNEPVVRTPEIQDTRKTFGEAVLEDQSLNEEDMIRLLSMDN